MPTTSPQSITLIPPRTSGGSIKNAANQIRYDGSKVKDAALAVLFGAIAKALGDLQSQVDGYGNALRQSIPLPEPIQITSSSGSLIAQLGYMLGSNNQSYSGIWANNLFVGGQGPDTAVLFSNGLITAIGQNGQLFVLDPYSNIGAWLGTQSEANQSVGGAINDGTGQVLLTVTAHGYRNGDWVNVASVGGVPNANGQWVIGNVAVNTFSLLGSTFAGSYTSGGTANRFFSGGAFETVAVAAGQRITAVVNNGSGLVRLTITGHGYKTGYAVNVTNVIGVPGANGAFLVTVVDANTVDLQGSTFSGSYVSGGISINWPTAKLLAQGDGSLLINNATITLTGNGITTTLNAANLPGDATSGGIGLDVHNNSTGQDMFVSGNGFFIRSSIGGLNYPVALHFAGASGSEQGALELTNIGANFVIQAETGGAGAPKINLLDNVTPNNLALTLTGISSSQAVSISAGGSNNNINLNPTGTGRSSSSGDFDTTGIYRKGGVAGLSVTRNMVASVTTGTGVFGTPGAGQSNGTVVTAVNLTSTTFSGGIITA